MPEKVPFQMITRSAQRALEEAERALATGAITPTIGVTAPAPQLASTPQGVLNPAQLVGPATDRRHRARSRVTGRFISTRTLADSRGRISRGSCAPKRRSAPFRRLMRRPPTRPRAANGRLGAGVNMPQPMGRDPLEGHDQLRQGPQIFDRLRFGEGENANDYQDHQQRIQEYVNSLPFAGDYEDPLEQRQSTPPSLRQEGIWNNRCISPWCPVPTTIPHERGFYQHNGQPNRHFGSVLFGLSNPPPAVWHMVTRVYTGTGTAEDRVAIDAFARNHKFEENLWLTWSNRLRRLRRTL